MTFVGESSALVTRLLAEGSSGEWQAGAYLRMAQHFCPDERRKRVNSV
jgi:hypothetical protein